MGVTESPPPYPLALGGERVLLPPRASVGLRGGEW